MSFFTLRKNHYTRSLEVRRFVVVLYYTLKLILM